MVIADAGSPSAADLGDSKTDGLAQPHATTNNSAKRRYRKRKRASYNNLLPSKGSTADNLKKVEGVEMLLIIERSCSLRSQATGFSNKFNFLSKTFLLSQPSKIQKIIQVTKPERKFPYSEFLIVQERKKKVKTKTGC